MAAITTYGLVGPLTKVPPGVQYSGALSALGPVDNSPPTGAREPVGPQYASVTSNLPISEVAQPFDCVRARSFLDDYYYRVHVRPQVIALGNLLSVQTRAVEVWSAYFTPQLLSSITQSGTDGIVLDQPQAPPTTFAELELRTYTLNISTNGSPVIDAKYVFNFPLEAPTVSVTGRRVVIWPFIPQTNHKEGLEWKTDILPAFNKEQRLALRAAPRQSFSYEFQLDPYQFTKAKAMATQWAHRVYGIPVWAELTYVGAIAAGASVIMLDTSNADYRADDLVIVWESDTKNAAVEILAVQADRVTLKLPMEASYAAAYVAPIRFARTFEGMTFKRSAMDYTLASATFEVTANADLGASVGYPQYRGKDVLTDRTILVSDLSERIARTIDEFDNGSGPVAVDIKNNWVSSSKTITFDTLTRAERWAARKWIHSRRGKQKGFWLPSWNKDLTLLLDVGSTGASLTVTPIGYPLYYSTKDVMILLKDGTKVFARITGGSTDANGNEVLSLSGAIGTAFSVAQVDMVCFMSHVRLNTDKVSISHSNAGRATISVPVIETPE